MSTLRKIHYGQWSAVLILSGIAHAQQAGTISGKILQDNGTPMSGAVVSAQAQRATAVSKPFRADAVTLKDGTFTIKGTPPGSYRICVQPQKDPLLSTCDWGLSPTSVTVNPSAITSVPTIQLQKGAPIQVQIVDPLKLVTAVAGKVSGNGILVGLWMPSGLFLPMPLQSSTALGRTHQIAVPLGARVNVSVHSSLFQLKDGTGSAVNSQKGASVSTQADSNGKSQIFTFTVTGKLSQ